eukprot:TRINITY_DN1966_c0_g2_i1.p1 TRINITY_DN1966_c0_g2~~TRINITY_DN1966_c0_g2_i1.p1  ORF type:complete len:336 (+),score=62.01 TRINITY_DN1966_c0_g2_i1:246-1253(+)
MSKHVGSDIDMEEGELQEEDSRQEKKNLDKNKKREFERRERESWRENDKTLPMPIPMPMAMGRGRGRRFDDRFDNGPPVLAVPIPIGRALPMKDDRLFFPHMNQRPMLLKVSRGKDHDDEMYRPPSDIMPLQALTFSSGQVPPFNSMEGFYGFAHRPNHPRRDFNSPPHHDDFQGGFKGHPRDSRERRADRNFDRKGRESSERWNNDKEKKKRSNGNDTDSDSKTKTKSKHKEKSSERDKDSRDRDSRDRKGKEEHKKRSHDRKKHKSRSKSGSLSRSSSLSLSDSSFSSSDESSDRSRSPSPEERKKSQEKEKDSWNQRSVVIYRGPECTLNIA